MTALLFLLLLGYQEPVAPTPPDLDSLIAELKYYDAATLMARDAHKLEDPRLLRQYVVFLVEHYASQIAFRTFFVKNLRKGEQLEALRLSNQQVTMDTHGRILERNLEALLQQALSKYPDNPDVAFAVSCYLFRGRGLIHEGKLVFSPKQIFKTFHESYAKGLVSVASLVALTMEAMGRQQYDQARAFLEKGLELAPTDPDLVFAHVNLMLRDGEHERAIVEARKLFEVAVNPVHKADALVAAARGLYAQKSYAAAAKTAQGVHRFAPLHDFALHVGLDSLRAAGAGEPYRQAVTAFITRDEQDPERFQLYMDYLRLRGIAGDDRAVMADYRPSETSEPLVHITRLVNIASYTRLAGNPTQAKAYLVKAHALASALETPPPDLLPILDALLAHSEGKAKPTEQ